MDHTDEENREIDLSKEIILGMIREDVPKAYFAEEFVKRKTEIQQAVQRLKDDAKESIEDIRKYGYVDETNCLVI